MLRINNVDGIFYLEVQPQNYENMYVVVRGLKENNERVPYEINEKDILKLGRVNFSVKVIGRHMPESKDPSLFSEKGNFCQQNDDQFKEIKKVKALCSPKQV